jgi:cytochrome o ubiquinol oxidase operon protein cyoD
MKADTHSLQPAHDAHPVDGHGEHHAGGSRESYLIGFGLSVILTAIPFWLVMSGVLGDKQLTGLAITVLAAIQIVVHMVYFLHMNTRSEGGWTMMALIFTIIMVVIGLTGTLWVMHHLNVNMMPGHDMSIMQ